MKNAVTPFTKKAKKVESGKFLELVKTNVKDRFHISFTCDIKEMPDDAVIRIGRGLDVTGGSWIELTKTQIRAYNFFSWTNPQRLDAFTLADTELVIEEFLTVSINVDHARDDVFRGNGTFVTITTKGGMKKIVMPYVGGTAGMVFASPVGCTLENCTLNYLADGYADLVWLFGDSYFSIPDTARWPTYLYRDGYRMILLAGYPGMNTEDGLTDFKTAIKKGTPTYAVWCLGMNNPDTSEEPNKGWLAATEEFLEICKKKKITPILATIPCTPKVDNSPKNEWVRNSGYRYIDFNRAVGADKDRAWYPEMLNQKDLVHPDIKGGEALYAQVLIDFPEIMQCSRK